MQSVIKQRTNSLQYIHISAETVLQMKRRGNSRWILHASQGGLSESSLLKSDGSQDGQVGRLNRLEAVAKDTETWAKSQGGGLPGFRPFRSDGSDGSQAGRLAGYRRQRLVRLDSTWAHTCSADKFAEINILFSNVLYQTTVAPKEYNSTRTDAISANRPQLRLRRHRINFLGPQAKKEQL